MNYLVIKCGGSVLDKLPASFYKNIVNIHKEGIYKPVIVHGGGPSISTLLTKLGITPSFIQGIRVTTEEVLDVVEMVLSGQVNKQIVGKIQEVGGNAYGISGVDGMLLEAKQISGKKELGLVGEIVHVKNEMIEQIISLGQIPVISPVSMTKGGKKLNVNGDIAAAAIAKALKGKLLFMSDIPGIFVEKDGEKKVIHELYEKEVEELIDKNVITGGMIPKVRAALDGVTNQVEEVVILNGMEENSLESFLNGKQTGTKILANKVMGNKVMKHA